VVKKKLGNSRSEENVFDLELRLLVVCGGSTGRPVFSGVMMHVLKEFGG
jgi:hypothetical protein